MEKFGRFATIMEIVRDVLMRACYVDPPERPPLQDRLTHPAGPPKLTGIKSASIDAEDALTSCVLSFRASASCACRVFTVCLVAAWCDQILRFNAVLHGGVRQRKSRTAAGGCRHFLHQACGAPKEPRIACTAAQALEDGDQTAEAAPPSEQAAFPGGRGTQTRMSRPTRVVYTNRHPHTCRPKRGSRRWRKNARRWRAAAAW